MTLDDSSRAAIRVTSGCILIASRHFGRTHTPPLAVLEAAGCQIVWAGGERPPTEAEMIAQVRDIDAIVTGSEPITRAVIEAAPRLKVIAKHGVGYDNVDLEAARARGIVVAVTAGALTESVADMAMGLILALARRIVQDCAATRSGEWKRSVGVELPGATLGIVGLGQIGKAVARRAAGFGMRLIACDAIEDVPFARTLGLRYMALEDVLRESDFVSLHAPSTPETRGLLNAERLGWMKPSAYLVNTARGGLVDETALYDALTSGRLAGAASDVFHDEPPGENPLLTLPQFLPTAHNAAQTYEALRKMGDMTAENVLRVLRGEEPLFRVA